MSVHRDSTANIFVSCAQADWAFRDALIKHLGALLSSGRAEIWHEGQTAPGGDAAAEARRRIDEADIVVLLVSPDFLASDACWKEQMPRALKRQAEDDTAVVPVLVRAVLLTGTALDGRWRLPASREPIDSPDDDTAWAQIAFAVEALLSSRRPGWMDDAGEAMDARRKRARDPLLRVEQICALREEGAQIVRRNALLFGPYLGFTRRGGRRPRVSVVGALDSAPAPELVDLFAKGVAQRRSGGGDALLVHAGEPAAEELYDLALERGVELVSFAEYEGLVDLSAYVRQQTERIERDPVYPPSLYLDQRAAQLIGRSERTIENALSKVTSWLLSPHPCFALVLADFGTGKTFLLREVARRLAVSNAPIVPVLIELRHLQKQRRLDALLAEHFTLAGLRTIRLDNLRYMIEEGKIALLFDGFDELESRVTYARAAEHFEMIAQAATGKAKIVVTSRTQHFLTDDDVKRELALRADAAQGARILRLQPFSTSEIQAFLARKLGSPEAAEARFALLDDVKDLLGLSKNPRMLSFITELPEERLRAARDRAGGKITAATLYGELLDRWLGDEVKRTNLPGAQPGLDASARHKAVRALAERLWISGEASIDLKELPGDVRPILDALQPRGMDHDTLVAQIGSGTLLVRDELGRFSFLHRSVAEYLVAWEAAESARRQVREAAVDPQACSALREREMSFLMADFFADMATPEVAIQWGKGMLAKDAQGAGLANARLVLRRQGLMPYKGAVLAKEELRGQDFSRQDLSGADLSGADLSGATLVEANLTGAKLRGSKLVRADLKGAILANADLREADLTLGRLTGADLRAAKLDGAVLRYAKILGARIDGDMPTGHDVRGALSVRPAAPPSPTAMPWLAGCSSLAVSPDSALLASGTDNGILVLWDLAAATPLRAWAAHATDVLSVAFSPDGLVLATGSNDSTLRLWSVWDGTLLRTLQGHSRTVWSIAFSPDGTELASGSSDGTIRLWSVKDGVETRTIRVLQQSAVGHLAAVLSVAFSPDGLSIASGSYANAVQVWSANDGAELRSFHGHDSSVRTVAFSPDGLSIASGSYDQTIRLWSTKDGSLIRSFKGHTGSVNAVAFSPDGLVIASASTDNTVRLRGIQKGTQQHVLQSHTSSINCIAFSGDGRFIVSGSEDCPTRIWRLPDGVTSRVLENRPCCIQSIAFSPDGLSIVSGSVNGAIRLWEPRRGVLVRSIKGNSQSARCLAFRPDGLTLASGSLDGIIRLWSTRNGAPLQTLDGRTHAIHSIAFNPDGVTLASSANDESISLWSTASGVVLRTFEGHSRSVSSVAFSPDGLFLASASLDRTVRLWDIHHSAYLRRFLGHSDAVSSIAFSPDGLTLASGSRDATVRVWSITDGTQLRCLEGHSGAVECTAFSRDGTILASGSADTTIRLWSSADGALVGCLVGHSLPVSSVVFSPDGRTLASGSDDGTIRLWRVTDGRCLAILYATDTGWVSFTPEGRYKLSGDLQGSFWHVIGLCRFEPGELDGYFPDLRMRDDEPFLP